MAKGFRLPRNRITPGEDRKVYDWVLTPNQLTTPNSEHVWDKNGGEAKEELLYWNDDWYWTEK